MSASDGDVLNPTIMGYRLRKAEDRLDTLADREQVSNLRSSMQERGRELDKRIDRKADRDDLVALRDDMRGLAKDVRGLRNTILGASIAFATGAAGVSLTLIGTHIHG